MTLLELERAKQGWGILNEIENYKSYIDRIEKDMISLVKLDDDLLEDAKKTSRYKDLSRRLWNYKDNLMSYDTGKVQRT